MQSLFHHAGGRPSKLAKPGEREGLAIAVAARSHGVDYEAALSLAGRANLREVLACKELGGRPEWAVDAFLSEDVWQELGGKAGLKLQAKKLLTLVAAAGRKVNGVPAPINPWCGECGELKFQHAGDRCRLDPIPCGCGTAEGGEPTRPSARGLRRLPRSAA